MPISVDEALSSYGYVYNIANAIPELKTYLQQATAGGWTQDKLIAEVESSPWWAQNSDTVRNLAIMQAKEPATYQQNIDYATNLVKLKARALGRTLDDATAATLAYRTLVTNPTYDDSVLSQSITSATGIDTTGGYYHGQAAQLRDHMTQVAQNYGVAYTDAFLNDQVYRIEFGLDTLDSFENLARSRAKATFPQLADQIDAGMTVRDVADPYISTMAKTLEIPETSITLNDPYVQKALSQRNPDGTATTQPMWKFAQDVKADPRYDHTDAAKTDAYSTLAKVGRDFGFTGAQ